MPVGRYPRPAPRKISRNFSLSLQTIAAVEAAALSRGVTQAAIVEEAVGSYLKRSPDLTARVEELQREAATIRERERANRREKLQRDTVDVEVDPELGVAVMARAWARRDEP